MKKTIHPGSVSTSPLTLYFGGTLLSVGTGFFYTRDHSPYLITNWHNVAERDPKTLQPLSTTGGIPNLVLLPVLKAGQLGSWTNFPLPLYSDLQSEQPRHPVWFVHPQHGPHIDVVAIQWPAPAALDIYPVNEHLDQTKEMRVQVADDVFVLGYPRGISGGGAYPIWKRASIATEPDLDLDGLPKMLIDTATREGMSGAPVLAISRGGYLTTNNIRALGGDGSRFMGVYSGRLGAGEMHAQLGVVWKASVIDEIIDARMVGQTSFGMA